MSAAFREAYPADKRPLLVVGGPRFDEAMAGELGVDRVFGRGTTPGEVASYLVHRLVGRTAPDAPPRSAPRVMHRRYVPYSHAHYAGNLVDGAYSLGLFGDVATEMCIRTDGDEGLFASYSDVQFRAPVRAGDVLEVTLRADPRRHPVADHGLRRATSSLAAQRPPTGPAPPRCSTRRCWRRRRPAPSSFLRPPVWTLRTSGLVRVRPARQHAEKV